MKMKKEIGIAALVGVALIGLASCSDSGVSTGPDSVPVLEESGWDVPASKPDEDAPVVEAPLDESEDAEAPTDAPEKIIKKRKPCSQLWCKPTGVLPATKSKRPAENPAPASEGLDQNTEPNDRQPPEGVEVTSETTPSDTDVVVKNTYKVRLVTGNHVGSGSYCNAFFKFCTDAEFDSCGKATPISPEDPSSEVTFQQQDIPDQHTYFRISLGTIGCSSDDNWLLQGVEIKTADDQIVYYNPCVNKWLAPDDHLNFGPKDTAVCAIIGTTGDGYTNTDDHNDVKLMFKGDGKKDPKTATNASEKGPHFTAPVDGYITMSLDWTGNKDYPDFTTNKVTSYGDYFFDSQPLPKTGNEFKIKKDPESNDLVLDSYEVFVFRPGKFADKKFNVLHQKITDAQKELEDENSDTDWILLSVIGVEGYEINIALPSITITLMGKILLDDPDITFDKSIGGYL